jgi:hypothetical protein
MTNSDAKKSQQIDPEVDAMTKVLAALEPLPGDARDRVAKWISDKLGMRGFGQSSKTLLELNEGKADAPGGGGSAAGSSNPKVSQWFKQNSITQDELDEVFHFTNDSVVVLASEMPGTTDSARVMNAYLLIGTAEFLKTGTPSFTDAAARELCVAVGCYDRTNHAKRVKGKELTGSKEQGWTLTGPGLKKAGALVKAIAGGA